MACFQGCSMKESPARRPLAFMTSKGTPRSRYSIETFHPNNREFEHNCRVDITDPVGGFLPGVLQVGIDDSSLELQARLDEEYAQLLGYRRTLRKFIFPRTPDNIPH
jgi:DNA-directed RNA polymerase II subunit RPB1